MIASRTLICPSTMLRHVGELASSKSAMNPSAPEFSALMTSLRSVGPVISTQRCWSAAGTGATVQSPVADVLCLGQEVQRLALGPPSAPLDAGVQQVLAALLELRVEL